MTEEQVRAEAIERYPIRPGMCSRQKQVQGGKREAYIRRRLQDMRKGNRVN